jgi:hypothetical protein
MIRKIERHLLDNYNAWMMAFAVVSISANLVAGVALYVVMAF